MAVKGGGLGEWFTLPVDRAGLVRRECGSCHRVFKVRHGEMDAASVQRALARKLAHANEGELEEVPPDRYCPYCGALAPDDAWFTSEQRSHVEKRADHWQREIRFVQLQQPRTTLSQNPYLTFLPVAPEPFAGDLADETDTLRPFPLVCCREQIRIQQSWHGPVCCHFCGAVHEVPRKAPGFLERLEWAGVDIG